MDKIRMLFLRDVEANNTNAQSLTLREVVQRFDPDRIESTIWYEHEPDSRLKNLSNIRLLRLPGRGKTWRIWREMISGYDVIAYFDYSPASYLFLHLPRMLRGRVRCVFQSEAPMSQMVDPSRALRRLSEGILRRCDVYTGVTEYVARDLEQKTRRKVSYILPLGVDTRSFTPPARRSNTVPMVLFAGTLIERKGPQHVIEAAARFPEARFRLVGRGRGEYEQVLKNRIAELRVTNVGLDGPKTQAQMLEIMRASDILLLPSRLEGMPKVTLEAAATGLPCIVFRDYETPSVTDGVTGFQVGALGEMMQALGKLIGDASLRERMGAAARKHAEKFDWEIVSKHWERAYLEIAANREG